MWKYEKRLQYPVKITQTNPKLAQYIMSQYGGPDGEAAASIRYLSQRYSMPFAETRGLLTDIGNEELLLQNTFRRNKMEYTTISYFDRKGNENEKFIS